MADDIHVKVAGAWKSIDKAWVKVAGAWKECDEVFVKQGGVWKSVWVNIQTYTSTGNRTSVNIFTDFGSPTSAGDFEWTNTGDIESGASGTYAVTTGAFPVGSTLKIINQGYIRGRGGNGGSAPNNTTANVGSPGQDALNLTMDVTIDNGSGQIWGGGGGGGGSTRNAKGTFGSGGGGGAGDDAGGGGFGSGDSGAAGTQTTGGAGGQVGSSSKGGTGGACGANGGAGTTGDNNAAGGAAGKGVERNGNTPTWLSGNSDPNLKGADS